MRRVVSGIAVLVVIGIAATAIALYATQPRAPRGPLARSHTTQQSFAQIERGRYLATIGDCAACHTDPRGGRPFAGGRAIETPFGVVVASNISPDLETGIGAWSDEEFADALKRGFGKGGTMLYPAMPFIYYTKVTDEDVNAIRAYLATVAPTHNRIISNRLPFPFNIRLAMRAWDALYFEEGTFRADPQRSTEWNRGAYLVQGLEHCGACHTPKSGLGGDKAAAAFQGYAIQGWYAPDITNDRRRGLGAWSVDEVVDYLRTGHNKQAAASGPMADEVTQSSSRLANSDLRAIAVFLKTLPGRDDAAQPVLAADPMMRAGRAIYEDACAACHRVDGTGVPGLFPTLKASPAVQSREAISLLRVVLDGAKSVATDHAPTGAAMPSYGWQLQDAQVAAVVTYIRNAWGNAATAVSTPEVASMRAQLAERPN